MSVISLNIDGQQVYGHTGQTILEIARAYGIEIPTLCHDDRVSLYGACGICVVEGVGMPKLLRSCSTAAGDGMVLRTDSPRVRKSRQTALELLLSDHEGDCRPPCTLACPGQTDCQGYVGLIANGQYGEALALIKEKIPLPGSIGRVCPHPCEDACRRQMVEQPISIAALKSFAADRGLAVGQEEADDCLPDTGKRVAVVGGGPGGLTAAYFLRGMGHQVTVYDAMPRMGGMLRYGIPEYRLTEQLLDEEIGQIQSRGIEFVQNTRVGQDVTLAYLEQHFDAVVVAIGAWTSSALRCQGEELQGVVGGIDFLRDVAMSQPLFSGRNVAVVGGGNTAMDACRTAVRLGAENVYNIYRRTRAEMPAQPIEIEEAIEEGVIFKNLTNPLEVVGEDGKVVAVRLQIMELGEPDASGRRAPVPVAGQEETLAVDTVIVAIGQGVDSTGFELLERTKWNTIVADADTLRTSREKIFAIGDGINKGPDIAIAAIGEGKRAAEMVDAYLAGQPVSYQKPYLVERQMTPEDFAGRTKQLRAAMPHRPADQRKHDFIEVNHGLSEEQARQEANRCLECGCMDYFECRLIRYANQYGVAPQKFAAPHRSRTQEAAHPLLERNGDKCILCGLCVRVCDEVVGVAALGLVDRGFDTQVRPALEAPLDQTDCISCGLCAHVCPTGAILERVPGVKPVPLQEEFTDTVCGFCSVGCATTLTSKGNLLLRSLPAGQPKETALLCAKGRFGFGQLSQEQRITQPQVRTQQGWRQETLYNALVLTHKRLQAVQARYGADSVAVAVSDRYSNEEIALVQAYAAQGLGSDQVFCFNRSESGLAQVLGHDRSTAALDQLSATNLILVIGSDVGRSHVVAGLQIRRAVAAGVALAVASDQATSLDDLAQLQVECGSDLSLLRQLVKAAMAQGRCKDLAGYDELAESLAELEVSPQAHQLAERYLQARRAVIVFDQAVLSLDAQRLIGALALLSGHLTGPADGIVQLRPNCNSQGLADLGVACGQPFAQRIADGQIKGLLVLGEDPDLPLDQLAFLAVQDVVLTPTAAAAHVVLPGNSYAETDGTVTSADGRVGRLRAAVAPLSGQQCDQLLLALGRVAGMEWQQPAETAVELPKTPALAVPQEDSLRAQPQRNTNALVHSFASELAKQGVMV